MKEVQISKVLAIQNFGSSGSKFVHSLFDNHPDILAIPSLYMLSFYSFWPEDKNRNTLQVIDNFINHFKFWFDKNGYPPYGTDKMGVNRNEKIFIEKDVFKKNLKEKLINHKEVRRNYFIQCVYLCYAKSYGRELKKEINKYIILYPHHTSNPKYAKELINDFKDVHFLYVFREPLQALGSSMKLVSTRWGGFVHRKTIAEYGFNMFLNDRYISDKNPYKIYAYSKISNVPCVGIRLEDLVEDPNNILMKLCKWLNLDWSDQLLESTYNGIIWWNRPESAEVSGFSNVPLLNKHKDVFFKLDKLRLDYLFSKIKSELGYDIIKSKYKLFTICILILFPFKIELLSIFPSKISFHKSSLFFKNFKPILNKIVHSKSLKKTGLKILFNDIIKYLISFVTLVPIFSYLRIRFLLYKTIFRVKNINFKYNVVKVINLND